MKLRSILIVLLAVFLVFALASCKNEPKEPENKPQPIPTDNTIYKLTATVARNSSWYGADKFRINLENGGVVVKEGSTLYFKFRATTEFYEFNLRSSIEDSLKWVYEQDKSKFESFSEPDTDGWITVTYTFGDLYNGNDASELYGEKTGFFLDFIGDIIVGDVLEIKNVVVDGKLIPITQEMIVDKYVKPTLEANAADNWADDGKYVVYYFLGDPDPKDSPYRTPTAEIVNAGQTITTNLEQEGKNLVIYNLGPESGFRHFDYDNPPAEAIFEKTTPITYNTKLYLVYTPIFYNVTFDIGEATSDAIPAQSIQHGLKATKPADPVKGTDVFAGWFTEGATTAFDFAKQTITADTALHAEFGAPVNVTFNAENGEAEHTVKQAANGYPVDPIADPEWGSKIFDYWYYDDPETAYDFSAKVTAPIELHAHWTNATKVTLVNYDRKQAKEVSVSLDEVLASDDAKLDVESYVGYRFAGWYDDAACETAHSFAAEVTGPFTLYAKWNQVPLYQMISKHATAESYDGFDKFAIDFAKSAKANDVLSFRYRSTTPITFYNIRNGSIKWIYQQPKDRALPACFVETKADDGWTYVTYTFTASNYDGTADIDEQTKFSLHFGAKTFVVGDVLEVQDITLNGTLLTLKTGEDDADGVVGTNTDVVTVVEGGAYEWGDLTVSFEMGEHADAIANKTIDFADTIEAPEVTVAEGYSFAGWYADSEFTKEFNFALPIIKDTTIYAKLGESATVTFSVDGGSEIAPVKVAKGNAVAQPADPKKTEAVFGGWYTDELLTEAYDFATPVTADITLYAKWVSSWTVSLSLNYEGAPAATDAYVAKGGVMTAPKNPTRVGYYFGGWYNNAECTAAHDFSAAVEASATIYAKWIEGDVYKFTPSKYDKDRLQFRWKPSDTNVPFMKTLSAGDVVTFLIKFTGTQPTNFKVRSRSETHTLLSETAFGDPVDGWIPVSVTLPSLSYTDNGLLLTIYIAMKEGDYAEIKGMAFNGNAIPFTEGAAGDSTKYSGAYEGCSPFTVLE